MIAWAALILWPVAAVIFFRNLTLPVALCVTIMGGYLFLPNEIFLDLPVLPSLSKNTIPTLVALLLTAIAIANGAGKKDEILSGWIPRSPIMILLLAALVIGTAGTVATNRDALVYGPKVLSGLRPYDFFSILLVLFLMLAPVFLGRRVLASLEGQRVLLMTIVLSALVYSFLALYEIRMAPQFHVKVYGFFQHTFLQHMRGDGFRPIVFLNHGLELSIFMTYAMLGTVCLFRTTPGTECIKWLFAAVWLFAILVLSKSLGALLIAIVLLPVALFLNLRLQLLTAVCIAATFLTYPMLRSAHVVPVEQVMELAENISPTRAASLNTRLFNEELLLEKALQKPLFGWGGWGRHRIFDEEGRSASITDGSWVIELGLGGWFRYVGLFGLICWPIIGLYFRNRMFLDPVCVSLALIFSAKLVDLIPNAGIPPFLFLIVGSLIGRLEMASSATKGEQGASKTEDRDAKGVKQPGGKRSSPVYAREFLRKPDHSADNTADRKPRQSSSYTNLRPRPEYRR